MAIKVSEDQVDLKENGDILLDGDVVGYLGWNENTLVDMEVQKVHRGRGIGTIAIKQMVEYITENNPEYDIIETTAVLSGAMGTALKRAGFEEEVVEKPLMSVDSLPDDVDSEDIATEEEIEYTYYI